MRCPICDKPTEKQYRPFCSRRCADVDLGRWMTGGYVIEGQDSPSDEDDERPVRPPLN
ncbi:DNA gyrase inhibitor YacG [Halovulum sp. GXIMD14794]